MGWRSGEFPGHGPKSPCFGPQAIIFALWQGAPLCWKRHCSSPNCSWMVGRRCSWRTFFYHSLFMFLGKIVSKPTLLAEKQPHIWMVSMLYCWLTYRLTFSSMDKVCSGCPKQSKRGFIRENDFTPVLSSPITVRFAECQSVPDVFLGKKWLPCCPSWQQAILQKSSPHHPCRCPHTCLLPFLSKPCTGGAPTPQVNHF